MSLQDRNASLVHICSSIAFNERGDQLASVGSWPDYLLTLWSWESEAIVLRSKAFSQVRCPALNPLVKDQA